MALENAFRETKLDEIRQYEKLCVFFIDPDDPQTSQMMNILKEAPEDFPHMHFAKVDVKQTPSIVAKYGITHYPTTLFFQKGELKETIIGASVPAIANVMKIWRKNDSSPSHDLQGNLSTVSGSSLPINVEKRIKELINRSTIMVFMKGEKENPFCRFSKQLVSIFNNHKIIFDSFDVFQDNDIREGLKIYSNWPTYPQVYIKGELVGGVDIIKSMEEDGTLKQQIPPECIEKK